MSRKVLWDSHGATPSARFAVHSNSDIRLLECQNEQTVKTLAVVSDLPAIKTLAWHPSSKAIFAAGLATGRTLLLRIAPNAEVPISDSQHVVVGTINARVSRPVNAIAFSPGQPNVEDVRQVYQVLISSTDHGHRHGANKSGRWPDPVRHECC
jgi:hypothetical protein